MLPGFAGTGRGFPVDTQATDVGGSVLCLPDMRRRGGGWQLPACEQPGVKDRIDLLLPVCSYAAPGIGVGIGMQEMAGVYQYRLFAMCDKLVIETIHPSQQIHQKEQHPRSLVVAPQGLEILAGLMRDELHPSIRCAGESYQRLEPRRDAPRVT